MSTYCTRANVEDRYGVDNIAQWADLDNDEDATKITNRITRAIAVVSAEIDDVARISEYVIPLADSAGATPTTIEELAATMCGIWLYEARGTIDFHPQSGAPYHRLAYKLSWVKQFFEELRKGERRLDAV